MTLNCNVTPSNTVTFVTFFQKELYLTTNSVFGLLENEIFKHNVFVSHLVSFTLLEICRRGIIKITKRTLRGNATKSSNAKASAIDR